jgi:hypothetical protein
MLVLAIGLGSCAYAMALYAERTRRRRPTRVAKVDRGSTTPTPLSGRSRRAGRLAVSTVVTSRPLDHADLAVALEEGGLDILDIVDALKSQL